ncbi:isopenicillin N synthase family dioxygenase [Ramlibacter sp.]|uniref:isopenicillin N synthase family dioxygenase n=1 Tax=Ramlibacter sp. TaxID=1917967 RepID=UPI003D14C9E9
MLPLSRRLAFSEVPVIDIAPLADSSRGGDAQATVRAIERACADVGFFYVQGHGVPPALMQEVQDVAKKFFDGDVERKMAIAMENSPQFRGYMPIRYKGRATEGKNIQEGFVMGSERPRGGHRLNGPNQWPEGMAEFRVAMEKLYAEFERVSRLLLTGFSQALGLEANALAPMFASRANLLKINHYPPQEPPKDAELIGVRGHTDWDAFTILWQDNVGGLEVLNRNDEWVVVPPVENSLVINIGDLLQIWSNGQFSSTSHRVINRYGLDRYSIPMFVHPDYDVTVRPLVGTVDASFEPFLAGDAQLNRHHDIWPQREAAAL